MPDLLRARPLIGMIHLPALPGSPRQGHSPDEVVDIAVEEASILEASGMDGLIVENVGDAPFFRESVSAVTVAAMAVIVRAVRQATSLAVGVNVLRNACLEALSIASVVRADFIRCNVVIGAYVTDQGLIQGCAAELARLRRTLDHDVAVLGDVHVKHAAPLFDVPIEDAAALEAMFCLIAHTDADSADVLDRIRGLLERGSRLRWDVSDDIALVPDTHPRQAAMLERLVQAMEEPDGASSIVILAREWSTDLGTAPSSQP